MEKVSVEELLLVISEQDSDLGKAHKSFNELYWRYSEFLKTAVTAHLKSKGIYNEEFIDTVVSNVFCEIFENPLNFSFDPNKHQSEDTAFKAWICRIAKYEFVDILNESIKHRKMNQFTSDGEIADRFIELCIEEEYISQNRQILEKALSVLKEREKHILLTYYDYLEDGKYTPSDVLDMLSEYWGTTRDNMRQIRKRSLDKVKQQIEIISQLKTVR